MTGAAALADAEVTDSIALIGHWATVAPDILAEPAFRPSRMAPGLRWSTQPVATPLVGFLTPANFPLLMALIDAVPALLAGCAALIKPSERAAALLPPLSETLARVPELAAVCALADGGPEAGRAIAGLVDHICFTGSVAAGRKVAVLAARRLIPATLELGGSDAAIVTESANVARAAPVIVAGAMANAGRSCLAIERCFAVGAAHAPLVAALVRAADALPALPPLDSRQDAHVRALLADALAQGARLATGGAPAAGPWPPVILTDVAPGMRILAEECFGPVLAVARADSTDAAIRAANDSPFGLAAAVFAGDTNEGVAIARRLNVGAVSINGCALVTRTAEPERDAFGVSGLGGGRSGLDAIRRFLRKKAIVIDTRA